VALPIFRLLLLQPNLATPEKERKNKVGSTSTTSASHPSGGRTDTKSERNGGWQETRHTKKDMTYRESDDDAGKSNDEGFVNEARPKDLKR